MDTSPLIEAAWEAGNKLQYRNVYDATREMDFRLITSYDNLETVYMDLLEPIIDETLSVDKR